MITIFIIFIGLILGSFISALTYRMPRGISISKGRSFCDNCKKQIYWFDNIPLLSFLLLKGKCRSCSKKISERNPLIEAGTAAILTICYLSGVFDSGNYLSSVLTLTSVLLCITVTVIDLEHLYIPDELVYLGLTFSLLFVLNSNNPFPMFASGFLLSTFLLTLHAATKGRGMGLGDVKLVLPLGMYFTITTSVFFMSLSFVSGAFVGILLLIGGQKKMSSKIPFGPFISFSYIITLILGDSINTIF